MSRAHKETPLERAQRYERSDRRLLESARQALAETDHPFKRRFYTWLVRLMETAYQTSTEKAAKAKQDEFR